MKLNIKNMENKNKCIGNVILATFLKTSLTNPPAINAIKTKEMQ